MHLKDPGTLMHLAFIPQAPDLPHSLISIQSSFADPVYPSGHKQEKLPFVLTHVAVVAQGFESHSLMSSDVKALCSVNFFRIKVLFFG